ncbi:hypothetical protein CTHBC1_0404 [Acetivibrio thermocellus BC1]|jgi:hypothetical protein|nr:hypothetical protein CTHBC1_0404 [Acetivibrio thermocellus BC1]
MIKMKNKLIISCETENQRGSNMEAKKLLNLKIDNNLSKYDNRNN